MINIKPNIALVSLLLLFVPLLAVIFSPSDLYAATTDPAGCAEAGGTWNSQTGAANGGICTGLSTTEIDAANRGTLDDPMVIESAGTCGGAPTGVITNCPGASEGGASAETTAVWFVLKLAIQIMTAGVGILAVGGIAYGAVLYASAGGSQEQTKKGITAIRNTVIGLLIFGFMFAIINFLIPGGVLS